MNSIENYLTQYKSENIYYKPNPGNGGDSLIALAAFQFFKRQGIKYQIIKGEEDLSGKIVFYAGGGNLISDYYECASFIKTHHKKVGKLILLPHTIKGHYELLSSLGTNVDIIAREETSYNYIKQFNNIGNVYLMDDLAFSLDKDTILNKYKWQGALWKLRGKVFGKKLLMKHGNFGELNAFRIDVEKTRINFPKDNIDVSWDLAFDCSMQNESKVTKNVSAIFHFLNCYSIINTDRLHLAICGAMLDKQVNFYPNSYWKNQAIFEYSIKNKFPNVIWKGEN